MWFIFKFVRDFIGCEKRFLTYLWEKILIKLFCVRIYLQLIQIIKIQVQWEAKNCFWPPEASELSCKNKLYNISFILKDKQNSWFIVANIIERFHQNCLKKSPIHPKFSFSGAEMIVMKILEMKWCKMLQRWDQISPWRFVFYSGKCVKLIFQSL